MQTKFVNLYGGPGVGKSTVAAGLFSRLKLRGLDAELVPEFAKELVWENHLSALENQSYVTARQFYMIKRLKGRCEYVVTDSPVFLGAAYISSDYPQCYIDTLKWWNEQTTTDGLNYFIQRSGVFSPNGRRHDSFESQMIDDRVKNLLQEHGIDYKVVERNNAIETIYRDVLL